MQDDPVEIINQMIQENAVDSPVDFVAMAGFVAEDLKGMRGAARQFTRTLKNCKTESNKVAMATKMADLFLKAHELQKSKKTATDLTREQLTAVLGLLNKELQNRDRPAEQNDGDSFGSPAH